MDLQSESFQCFGISKHNVMLRYFAMFAHDTIYLLTDTGMQSTNLLERLK